MNADEHPKPETTVESLAKLSPVFKKNGTVDAGNASVGVHVHRIVKFMLMLCTIIC